jgi:hypothetical protein
MSYRNKVYVAFDGDNDINYYHLMKAWKQNDGMSFNFYDAHDLNTTRDTSQEESIKRQLKERLNNSKVFVLLVGEKTKFLYKFIRWEIEQALTLKLPIIVVNLNGMRCFDQDRCPAILHDKVAVHIAFSAKILEHALNNWSNYYKKLLEHNNNYYYDDNIYNYIDKK